MLVNELSTRNVVSCLPETDLASVASLLWDHDCGILPVVDSNRNVIGVLTDRDICMALATRDRLASQLSARDVMSANVHTIHETDTTSAALKTMRLNRVRRLPITAEDGRLKGILSMNDLILASKADKSGSPTYEEVVTAMKGICGHNAETLKGKAKRHLAATV